jgi:hypothetical protein
MVFPMEAATSRPEGEQREGDNLDQMGKDKYRTVIGESHGPSKVRQFAYYAGFILFVAVLYFGAKFAVSELDKAPKNSPDKAPWAQEGAPQRAPQQFQ